MSKKIVIVTGQSLIDIAIQELGSASGLVNILSENRHIDPSEDLAPGTELEIPSEPIDLVVANHFSSNNIKIATASEFKEKQNAFDPGFADPGLFYKE